MKRALLYGRPLALPTSTRLGWKVCQGQTLAYYGNQLHYGHNKFYSTGPRLSLWVSATYFKRFESVDIEDANEGLGLLRRLQRDVDLVDDPVEKSRINMLGQGIAREGRLKENAFFLI